MILIPEITAQLVLHLSLALLILFGSVLCTWYFKQKMKSISGIILEVLLISLGVGSSTNAAMYTSKATKWVPSITLSSVLLILIIVWFTTKRYALKRSITVGITLNFLELIPVTAIAYFQQVERPIENIQIFHNICDVNLVIGACIIPIFIAALAFFYMAKKYQELKEIEKQRRYIFFGLIELLIVIGMLVVALFS